MVQRPGAQQTWAGGSKEGPRAEDPHLAELPASLGPHYPEPLLPPLCTSLSTSVTSPDPTATELLPPTVVPPAVKSSLEIPSPYTGIQGPQTASAFPVHSLHTYTSHWDSPVPPTWCA